MDDVDRRWIHGGLTALAGIVAGGTMFGVGLQYITAFCRTTSDGCDFGAITMVGISVFWATVAAFAAAQWAWRRRAPHALAFAMTLAWVALHFVRPASAWRLYGSPLEAFLDGADAALGSAIPGFLAYWLLAAAVGILTVWWVPHWLEGRLAAREAAEA